MTAIVADRLEFGDGQQHELGPGGVVWVDAPTVRRFHSVGDEDLVLLAVGGKGGYIGRDGVSDEESSERVRRE